MSKSKRKLAAIVFTDIVGFTKLSSENEPAALALLEAQRELLKPIVKGHGGDWLKEIGDGLLLTFDSIREAVNCAIEIQTAAKSIPELQLRIGIHQGEVFFNGDDVLGDDVNIASRIEPFSPVGGIAISDIVNNSLKRDPEYSTVFLTEPNLKGVSQKVKVHCIDSHGLPNSLSKTNNAKLEPERSSIFRKYLFTLTGAFLVLLGSLFWFLLPLITIGFAGGDGDYEKRIAVLYLENRGDENDDYLSDGLTEEIMNRLTRLENLSVVSRYDVLDYKNQSINLDNLKKELGADYVLTGSITKIKERIKVSIELVDLFEREVKWNSSIEREIRDIFAIQDEIAINIVNHLDLALEAKQKDLVLRDPSKSVDAYFEIIQTDALYSKESIEKEITRMDSLLLVDSTYADAYAMRASMIWMKYIVYDPKYWNWYDIDETKALQQMVRDTDLCLVYDADNSIGLGMQGIPLFLKMVNSNPANLPFNIRKFVIHLNRIEKTHPTWKEKWGYPKDLTISEMAKSFAYGGLLENQMFSVDYEEYYLTWKKPTVEIYKELSKNLTRTLFGPISLKFSSDDLIRRANLHNDFSLALDVSESKIALLSNYEKFSKEQIYMDQRISRLMIGDNAYISKHSKETQKLSNDFEIIIKLKIDEGLSYFNSGQLDKASYLFEELAELNEENSFGLDLFAYYGSTAAYYYDHIKDYETAYILMKKVYDNLINDVDNEDWTDWKPYPKNWQRGYLLECEASLAKYHAMLGDVEMAKSFIISFQQLFEVSDNYINSWSFPKAIYNLSLAYNYLEDYVSYEKYLNLAYDHIVNVSDKLNDEHEKMYQNNIIINKEIYSRKSDI